MEETKEQDRQTEPEEETAPDTETAAEEAEAGQAAGAEDGEESAALRRELEASRARVTELERERLLLARGVPEEDLDYYVFKIGKLVTEKRDFAAAAGEYLKQRARRHPAPVSTGASLSGRTARTQSVNETMNRLLRGE